MTSMVMIAMTAWLWLGLIPQLVLGDRHLSSWHLLGEWVAGPIGLAVAFAHRHATRPLPSPSPPPPDPTRRRRLAPAP